MQQLYRRVRIIIPIILALIGVGLMTGCIQYLVWPTRIFKAQYDFRSDIGDAKSYKPVRPGAITRQQVMDRFGVPVAASEKDRTTTYRLRLKLSERVWPLCFTVEDAKRRDYKLVLQFDLNDVLADYKLFKHDDERSGMFVQFIPPHDYEPTGEYAKDYWIPVEK
jgi:hypothetical protein